LQLIIREYLSMLKESRELDSLLGDLLLSMEIEPISRAQIGVRQYGVDLAAVGLDPEDGVTKKLFLFTIKSGDINRSGWDAAKQGVRSSLNEIIDVYIPNHLDKNHKQFPKKIIVCCNGELKQEVQQNWTGYQKQNATKAEFDFWGADKLSLYISEYFLDEYLFPESARKKIRRSLSLVGLPEYDLNHFYTLVDEILFDRKLPKSKGRVQEKKRLKAIRLVHLALRILSSWGEEEGNTKPGLLAAEYTLLRVWDWMRLMNLLTNTKTLREFYAIYYTTYQKIAAYFFNKIFKHCHTRDGLFGWGPGAEVVEYPIRVFEIIGIISTLGLGQYFEYATTENNHRKQDMLAIAETLAKVIHNNTAANSPCFDGHSIDICLGLMLLSLSGHKETAEKWIQDLTGKICFAFRTGKHFPVSTDSYDDLIALEIGQASTKEDLTSCSTIFPILAQWCAKLDLKETYKNLFESVKKVFPQSSMQIWYPDEKTDNVLYKQDASRSGTTLIINLPETLAEVRKQMENVWEHVLAPEQISCLSKNGFSIIGLIASRHFRTPVIPAYWQVRKRPEQLNK